MLRLRLSRSWYSPKSNIPSSVGTRQRIGIARALAVEPELIICDEPTSALDVTVRAQVLELLESLQKQYQLSYLFITHDLSIIPAIAHKVAVMQNGKVVEQGTVEEVMHNPQHEYTQKLLNAIPDGAKASSSDSAKNKEPLLRVNNLNVDFSTKNGNSRAVDDVSFELNRGEILGLVGESGSGKSTIANALEQVLHKRGIRTYILDGDNVRHGLNKDLGFTDADRVENIRRISEVAKLMVDAGVVVLTAFISPFRAERDMARSMFEEGEFVEIFVDTPLEVAEARDPKGLYKTARRGELPNFTGIGSPYEAPEKPDLVVSTVDNDVDAIVNNLLEQLEFRA